jgi:uncharacterized protein YtpQ (UPF0354 family)
MLSLELYGQLTKSNLVVKDPDWNSIKHKVYPMLKQSLTESDNIKTIDIKESEKPIVKKYLGDVVITYLIDFEDIYVYINKSKLEKWGIGLDSLNTTAIDNLEELAESQYQLYGDSSYAMITLNGNLEASLILCDKFWDNISYFLPNKSWVIAIPARDLLVLSAGANEKGINKLKDAINETFIHGDHLISRWLFIRENNKWNTYQHVE